MRSWRIRGPALPRDLGLLLVLSAICVAPIVTSVLRAGTAWIPTGDSAIILARARATFTADSPLLGMPTSLGVYTGEQVHHLGPSEFWVVRVGELLTGGLWGAAAAIAVVQAAAVVTCLVAARAVGGRRALAIAAFFLTCSAMALRFDVLLDPFNPNVAVFPLAAFVAATIAWLVRGPRWLIPAVVFGTISAQAHLTVGVIVAIGAAVALLVALVARLLHVDEVRARVHPAAAVIAVLLWAPPLLDQAFGSHNLSSLLRASGSDLDTIGLDRALGIVVRAFVRPVWMSEVHVLDLLTPPPAISIAVVAAGAAALTALLLSQLRRRPALAVASALVLAMTLVGLVMVSRLPDEALVVLGVHNYLWTWPLSAACTALLVLVATARVPERVVVLVAGIAAGAVLLVPGLAPEARPVGASWYSAAKAAPGALRPLMDRRAVYLVDVDEYDIRSFGVGCALVAALDRDGYDVRVDPRFERSFGRRLVLPRNGDADAVISVAVEAGETPVTEDEVLRRPLGRTDDVVVRLVGVTAAEGDE